MNLHDDPEIIDPALATEAEALAREHGRDLAHHSSLRECAAS